VSQPRLQRPPRTVAPARQSVTDQTRSVMPPGRRVLSGSGGLGNGQPVTQPAPAAEASGHRPSGRRSAWTQPCGVAGSLPCKGSRTGCRSCVWRPPPTSVTATRPATSRAMHILRVTASMAMPSCASDLITARTSPTGTGCHAGRESQNRLSTSAPRSGSWSIQ
jgi:hypothetical protein